MMAVSTFDQDDIQAVAANFPAYFAKAQEAWAKFKAGEAAGLFSISQRSQVLGWFRELPKAWAGFRPNWTETLPGGTFSAHRLAFADTVDAWIESLKRDLRGHGVEPATVEGSGLGLAFLIIAGIIILLTFGAAGAVWAVGYFKEQSNISRMVDEVVAGKLPANVLEAAIKKEQSSSGGFLGDISGVFKWGLLAWAVVQFGPMLVSAVKKRA